VEQRGKRDPKKCLYIGTYKLSEKYSYKKYEIIIKYLPIGMISFKKLENISKMLFPDDV